MPAGRHVEHRIFDKIVDHRAEKDRRKRARTGRFMPQEKRNALLGSRLLPGIGNRLEEPLHRIGAGAQLPGCAVAGEIEEKRQKLLHALGVMENAVRLPALPLIERRHGKEFCTRLNDGERRSELMTHVARESLLSRQSIIEALEGAVARFCKLADFVIRHERRGNRTVSNRVNGARSEPDLPGEPLDRTHHKARERIAERNA